MRVEILFLRWLIILSLLVLAVAYFRTPRGSGSADSPPRKHESQEIVRAPGHND